MRQWLALTGKRNKYCHWKAPLMHNFCYIWLLEFFRCIIVQTLQYTLADRNSAFLYVCKRALQPLNWWIDSECTPADHLCAPLALAWPAFISSSIETLSSSYKDDRRQLTIKIMRSHSNWNSIPKQATKPTGKLKFMHSWTLTGGPLGTVVCLVPSLVKICQKICGKVHSFVYIT